jgi:aryl-alcohol dehydrogenase
MRITGAVMTHADGMVTRRKIELEDVELDGRKAEEVLICVRSCGVCGTEKDCIQGLEPYPTPGVFGHEGAGIVEGIGSDLKSVRAGDRLMIGLPFCGECRTGRRGEMRHCENGTALCFSGQRLDGSSGMKRLNGELAGRLFQQSSWATQTAALERQLAKVPEGLDLNLCGPYGCISTGAGTILNELKRVPGSAVAIFGAGSGRTAPAQWSAAPR